MVFLCLLTDVSGGYILILLNNYATIIHNMLTEKQIQKNRKIFSDSDEVVASTFKVLGVVNRYRIFRLLLQHSNLTVSDIAQILDISLPLASQHIKILQDARLLHKERGGKKIFPTLKYDNPLVQAAVKTIEHTIQFNGKKSL